jgi:hypothetical protein
MGSSEARTTWIVSVCLTVKRAIETQATEIKI